MLKKSYALYITLFFSFAVAHFFHPLSLTKNKTKTDPFTINEQFLQLIDSGNDHFFSGIYWVLTLLQSDNKHYEGNDKSWMFYRFNLISTLDPHFYTNYEHGGLYLAIIKDDPIGAKLLYERGLKVFPKDFILNFHAGFNDFFELGLDQEALKKFNLIIDHPLVYSKYRYIPSIVAKLKADQGNLEEAYKLLTIQLKSMKHPFFRKHFTQLIYTLRAKIDLDCLNNLKKENCRLVDEEGQPYIKDENGFYKSRLPLKTLKIKKARQKAGP